MFDRELIENRAMTEQANAMHEPYVETIGEAPGGITLRTGAVVREDGSVAFRRYDWMGKKITVYVNGKAVEAEETTRGGIILAAAAKEKPQIAEIVAVGPGGIVDGKEIKMNVKVGDRVITAKYTGTEVKIDDVEYTIVRQEDILAIVE